MKRMKDLVSKQCGTLKLESLKGRKLINFLESKTIFEKLKKLNVDFWRDRTILKTKKKYWRLKSILTTLMETLFSSRKRIMIVSHKLSVSQSLEQRRIQFIHGLKTQSIRFTTVGCLRRKLFSSISKSQQRCCLFIE